MNTFTFDNFDYIDSSITFPKDIVFYRGVNDSVISSPNIIRDEYPLYIAPEHIAKEYGKVYKVVTTKPIQLLDIRKLKNIIQLIIASRKTNDPSILNPIRYLTISFGLCSYYDQIRLLDEYMKNIDFIDENQLDIVNKNIDNMKYTNVNTILNPISPEGVRVAETYIDSKSMMILRELFKDIYDGFIAPKMFSTFHVNNMTHEEIVIFNPKESGIQSFTQNIDINKNSLNTVLDINYKSYILKNNIFKHKIFTSLRGGASGHMDPINKDRYKYYENKEFMKETIKEVKMFVKSIQFKKYKYDKPQLLLSDKFVLPPPIICQSFKEKNK